MRDFVKCLWSILENPHFTLFFSLVSSLIVHFCPLKKKVEYECIFVQEIQDFLTLFFVYFSYVITEEFLAHGANINCLGLSLVDSLSQLAHKGVKIFIKCILIFIERDIFEFFISKLFEACLYGSSSFHL